jgi:hypothetical protein
MFNAYVAKHRPIHPTVLIFQCTSSATPLRDVQQLAAGDRKTDMTLAQIDKAFQNPLWKNIEMAMLSGGEPTPETIWSRFESDHRPLPKLRKYGINTTGLTPHRRSHDYQGRRVLREKGIIFSAPRFDRRRRRDAQRSASGEERLREGNKTITAMKELQKRVPFNFGVSATIFNKNIDDCENILAWAKKEQLDIVFNMVRFSDPMLGNGDLSNTVKPIGRDEERLRQFFLERGAHGPAAGWSELHPHALCRHDPQRLPPRAPCPFQNQGIMLNPDGGLFFCENSEVLGNVVTDDAEELYFRATSQKPPRLGARRQCRVA